MRIDTDFLDICDKTTEIHTNYLHAESCRVLIHNVVLDWTRQTYNKGYVVQQVPEKLLKSSIFNATVKCFTGYWNTSTCSHGERMRLSHLVKSEKKGPSPTGFMCVVVEQMII